VGQGEPLGEVGKTLLEQIGDLVALPIALAALLVSIFYNRQARRQSLRVEKSTAYLSLEMHSSEVFKYEAEHDVKLAPFRTTSEPPLLLAEPGAAGMAENLYFQTLNLFEVCTRFRRDDIIDVDIFASWVAWFYDTLDDWYFRRLWQEGMRDNYAHCLRVIFDEGVRVFADLGDAGEPLVDAKRRMAFYQAVGRVMNCENDADWRAHAPTMGREVEPEPEHGPELAAFGWTSDPDELKELAAFLSRVIGSDPAYISHGEIQNGLSDDGQTWASDLTALMAVDLSSLSRDRAVLVARSAGGDIVAGAIVQWADEQRLRFAIIEDLAVAPEARSRNIGARMIGAIEAEAQRRGAAWIFLESGRHNLRAHSFFDAQGFKLLSKVFGKPLAAAKDRANRSSGATTT